MSLGAAFAALSATIGARESHAQQAAVPNSAGTQAPMLKPPANGCDCHMHIYDAERFPNPQTLYGFAKSG
jgi:hypothetical protein